MDERRTTAQPLPAAEKWIHLYEEYLLSVRGACLNTRRVYAPIVTRLMNQIAMRGAIDWQELTAERIAEFVLADSRGRRGGGAAAVAAAVRSFLRFLVLHGVVRAGLELAIPRVRTYSHAGLPQYLSKNEVQKLLGSAADGTAMGKRNMAILLLLSTFGLRAAEVAGLELQDIDWSNGLIFIRTTKNHRPFQLPLLRRIGEALLDYLQDGRPSIGTRSIFLQHTIPYRPVTATAISKVVGHQIRRAGLRPRMYGAHILRHSVATRLINNGSSFKDVADLLGHRTIDTTAIYAKVHLAALAKIGLPWPGGELK
jgi:site-specific recombinase XerD